MSENLKIGDSYMIIEETDDYIKKTTGTIKDVNKYSISSVEYLLKRVKSVYINTEKETTQEHLKLAKGKLIKQSYLILIVLKCHMKNIVIIILMIY